VEEVGVKEGLSVVDSTRLMRHDLRSCGTFRSAEWFFCTDVSGQPIGLIFTGQEFKEEKSRKCNADFSQISEHCPAK
jgi:hypothetical protein